MMEIRQVQRQSQSQPLTPFGAIVLLVATCLMLTCLAIALLVTAPGCAAQRQTIRPAYATGKALKDYTDAAHLSYSLLLNEQKTKCDPATNEHVHYKEDFDECMTPAYEEATAEKIVVAFQAYKLAAEAYTAVLLNYESPLAEKYQSWSKVVEAAFALVKLFPDAEKHVAALEEALRP